MSTKLEVCRVTVVTPTRWADVALPATESLADLIPALLDHLGEDELADGPLTVQLLGRPPLDQARSLSSNGVLDGHTLYIQPGGAELPEIDFDDAVSGIAAGVHELPTRWTAGGTRAALLGLAAVPVIMMWVVVTFGPLSAGAAAAAALAAAGTALAAAGVASRAWGDGALAILLGLVAVPFAAVGGIQLVASVSALALTSPATWLAAAALTLAASSAGHALSGTLNSGFAGIALGSLLVGLASGAAVVAQWSATETLAVILVLATLTVDMVVGLSCRLAGVVLPALPRTSEELEDVEDPVPAADVVLRAARVDAYLGGLLWGLAAVAGLSGIALLPAGPWAVALVLAASASMLLRTRTYESMAQRLALLAGGLAAPAVLVVLATVRSADLVPLVVMAALAAGTALAASGRVVLPGTRVSPRVGRLSEILEIVAAVGLLPLLLAVFDTYSVARNLF